MITVFSFHGYSSRVIKAKRATGEYTQRIPLWRAETRDNASPALAPERQHWMKLLSAGWARGAAWGAPRQLLLLANLAACTHSAPAHTHAPDKHQELAGRGQGASSATPGRVRSSTGMLAAHRCHDWRETRRKKLLRSLRHFTCCEQRHLLNTQSAKAAEQQQKKKPLLQLQWVKNRIATGIPQKKHL